MSQPIKTVLAEHQDMHEIIANVQRLISLQRLFASVVPGNLAKSAQVLGLLHEQLIVAAANATVAAKLRQIAPELALQLKSKGCEVSGIRIKVQVSFIPPAPQHTPRILSEAARKSLHELSSGLKDSALKHALDRMTKVQD